MNSPQVGQVGPSSRKNHTSNSDFKKIELPSVSKTAVPLTSFPQQNLLLYPQIFAQLPISCELTYRTSEALLCKIMDYEGCCLPHSLTSLS